jgi:hypothetical protein
MKELSRIAGALPIASVKHVQFIAGNGSSFFAAPL